MVEAAGKRYPAYKTDCTEHIGRGPSTTPRRSRTVRMEQNHKRNGQTLVEFVERLD
jgi:hypothetical protein